MLEYHVTFDIQPIQDFLEGWESQSWSTSYLDSLARGYAKLVSINKSCLKNSSTKLIFVEDIQGKLRHGGSKKGQIF